ncbi:MAG: 50S ribosomal protein L19 [Candidatus Caldatribacteriota bacterium]|jgi:large subunit ribosomal protein L19|nr:50S ribosomal protein L19 [Atribacterota bacterium]MDD3640200.1 50S ribosomal protein L19 [Atribacterota bacterium]MDD4288526.1 50S ribosomal protein L19 [Atribacterota bacterium]MDD4764706.1 50S ribosomal protein L19 [Atribacterota bacterium]MDD5635172.1 50S ribosomal protein L19 [Atribacterota bacterium]
MDFIKDIENAQLKKETFDMNTGDLIEVHQKIIEGDRKRIQIFRGILIARKHGGSRETITVRKVTKGIGVEKIFPLNSPNIEKIELIKRGSARKAKLYYLRNRVGQKGLMA